MIVLREVVYYPIPITDLLCRLLIVSLQGNHCIGVKKVYIIHHQTSTRQHYHTHHSLLPEFVSHDTIPGALAYLTSSRIDSYVWSIHAPNISPHRFCSEKFHVPLSLVLRLAICIALTCSSRVI